MAKGYYQFVVYFIILKYGNQCMLNTPQSFATSTRTLKMLAAFVWILGGIILILKGSSLLVEADAVNPNSNWPYLAIILGITIGSIKAIFLFRKSCKNNLNRINTLIQPKIWQFYRSGFFIALIAMIIVGSMLSKIAHGNYTLLISVAIIDISIAVALLGSSYIFLKR